MPGLPESMRPAKAGSAKAGDSCGNCGGLHTAWQPIIAEPDQDRDRQTVARLKCRECRAFKVLLDDTVLSGELVNGWLSYGGKISVPSDVPF